LENARLFDETQRLLTETNERAAELQIINSVQEGLAAKLDMQSMYDLVGDKIQQIFDAQVADIGIYDFEAGVTRFPYGIERGVRIPDEPVPMGENTKRFISEGKPQTAVAEWTFRTEGNHLRQVGTVQLSGMKVEESRAYGWDERRKRFWSYTLVEPFATPRVEWGTYNLGELVWLSEPWDIGTAEGPVESRATTTRDGAALRFRIDVKRKAGWEKVAEGRFTKEPD
jgi:hypothetical protein